MRFLFLKDFSIPQVENVEIDVSKENIQNQIGDKTNGLDKVAQTGESESKSDQSVQSAGGDQVDEAAELVKDDIVTAEPSK